MSEELERLNLELLSSVGGILRDIREEQGLTQRQVAAKIETAQARVSDMERGQGNPFLTSIHKHAYALGYTIQVYFFEMEDDDAEKVQDEADADPSGQADEGERAEGGGALRGSSSGGDAPAGSER